LTSVGLALLVVVGALGPAACVHPAATPTPDATERRLRALDVRFGSFVAERLGSLHDIEPAVAELEALRLDWLDELGDLDAVVEERPRLLVLVRLAEMHLDLAARIRRVPYAPGLDDDGRAAFDAALSREALPLEAIGQGILAQVVHRATRADVDGRFVRRARLYQRLHAGRALDDADLAALRTELVATTFRAPSTLLQAERIGQRASR
jgi:hypothetical protein